MKTWKIAVVALALLLAGCGGALANSDTQSRDTPQASGTNTAETTSASSGLRPLLIDTSAGKKVEVQVEVADAAAEQARGLMYRTALGEDRGMLFVYPDERELSFWMKNTLIPLSIAYIDSDGRIVDIQDMKPLDDKPPHYNSSEPVQYALEVNQGFYDEHGVKTRDRVELPG
ncbi:MAG: DUF192 domain-containing protein [Rubrobacteraceae bacterium]|nr:DUF192 domain-containing protein [Rubrobacteraceae bacterium]